MGDLINLKGKSGLSINNLSATRAEILIYADIGKWWDEQVSANDIKSALDDMPDTVNEIIVRINSPGGDVFQGWTIHNLLKQFDAKITVYIDGMAASIASIIMLAGDEIIMGEGTMVMIHKPWTWAAGNSKDLENSIELLDSIEEQLVGAYHRKTGLDKIEIRQMLAKETWMDATQAVEKGFVDRKMEDDENVDVAASADMSKFMNRADWINKKPAVKDSSAIARDKISKFKQKAQGFLARK